MSSSRILSGDAAYGEIGIILSLRSLISSIVCVPILIRYSALFLSQLLKTKTMSSTFVPDTQKPERSSTKEHANYFSRQMDWPKYFRVKFLLKTWRSSLVDATTSNFQKMREKNLPKPLKKIPHLIKVTIYQEVVTFSSHNQD